MGVYTPVTIAFVSRETLPRGQIVRSHVIIGTPGTIFDLVRRRQIDLSGIRIMVLDEADNMISQQNLGEQSFRIKNLIPKDSQIVLFSATFPPEVQQYAQRFTPNANELTLRQEELKVDAIKQLCMTCDNESRKYEALVALYGLLTIGQSIIFVQRKTTANEVRKTSSR